MHTYTAIRGHKYYKKDKMAILNQYSLLSLLYINYVDG